MPSHQYPGDVTYVDSFYLPVIHAYPPCASPDDSRRALIMVPSDRTRALISITLWRCLLPLLVLWLSFEIPSGRLITDVLSFWDLYIYWDKFSFTSFVTLILAALSLESVQFAISLSGLSDQFAAIYADIYWHLHRRWISCLLSSSTPHPHSLGGCTLWWFNSTSHYYLRALDKSLIDLL